MDPAGNGKVGSVVGIEVLKIVDVLEIVGVDLTAVDNIVGLDIVLKLDDLELIALGLQDRLYLSQDLSVRCGARGDSDMIVFRSFCSCCGRCFLPGCGCTGLNGLLNSLFLLLFLDRCGAGAASAAAGEHARCQDPCQHRCHQFLFHNFFLLN